MRSQRCQGLAWRVRALVPGGLAMSAIGAHHERAAIRSCYRDAKPGLSGELACFGVARVGMAQHSDAWVARQHTLSSPRGGFGAVNYRYLPRMLRITDADAASVMYG